MTDSFAGQPRGHKRVRSDFIRHHGITGEKQDKSTSVRRVPSIKALNVRHSSIAIHVTREYSKSYEGIPRVQIQDLIDPSQAFTSVL
jgi:hypothetical protein